ncbi:MAG: 3-ketosteroid 9alpha-monooxygenase subunit A [Hyphomicrobiaceae bacterium]|jgi:3-ketosteroid 9alpha-monooxygenase subunit A
MSERYPMYPYPIGWFQVAYGDELEVRQAKPLKYFGTDLVLYRGEDGAARVRGAFCPHLGAHFGYGGEVEGTDIRCPFHGWRFSGEDGKCNDIPYGKRIPAAARTVCWPTIERNGLIMVWHHPDKTAPSWDIPVVAEYGDTDWTPYERRFWRIKAHNQELAENQVDLAHFRYVHGALTIPESSAEADGPCMRVSSVMKMGTPMGPVDGTIQSEAWGFGFGTVRFGGIVDTVLITSVTPIDGEHVDARFAFSVKKLGDAASTRGVGKALIQDIDKQMDEDIPIWENKRFLDRPALCDGDGPIGLFRKWCTQFYPAENPSS